MDIRDIDKAGRLYDRASVTRVALRSLVWGIPLFWIGVVLGMAFGPGDNIPVAEWLPVLAPSMGLSVLVIVLALAALWATGWLGRIVDVVLVLLVAIWCVQPFMFIEQVRVGGWTWLVGAIARSPILIWASAEIGFGAVALMLASRADLVLAREPVGWASLLGAPPALRALARGRLATTGLFVLIAFLFALAVMQITMLINSAAVSWNNAVNSCAVLPTDQQIPCIAAFGWGDMFGQFVVWPLTFLGWLALARLVRWYARRRTLQSAADAMMADSGDPILFLRWFGNDAGNLREAGTTPVRWLFATTAGEPTLDRLLVETYSAVGPTIALGDPDRKDKPTFGVWRDYPDKDKWQEHLRDFAAKARAIVLVVDAKDTPGVTFELDLLSDPALQAKTLFLAGLGANAADKPSEDTWQRIATHSRLIVPPLPAGSGQPLGVFHKAGGSLAVAVSKRFTRSDYAMTLRWFFDEREKVAAEKS